MRYKCSPGHLLWFEPKFCLFCHASNSLQTKHSNKQRLALDLDKEDAEQRENRNVLFLLCERIGRILQNYIMYTLQSSCASQTGSTGALEEISHYLRAEIINTEVTALEIKALSSFSSHFSQSEHLLGKTLCNFFFWQLHRSRSAREASLKKPKHTTARSSKSRRTSCVW